LESPERQGPFGFLLVFEQIAGTAKDAPFMNDLR